MKTHKHLWDDFISTENFAIAAKRAVRSKRSKKSTKRFLRHADVKLAALRERLQSGKYKTSQYTAFMIHEPKQRIIFMLPLYPDHILHHALINILGPIWQKMFIADSYACIPGRGLHAASRRCAELVRKNKYVLQCDVKKFYPSINHDVMMRIISRKITDRRMLVLLNEIVRSLGGECGLPIGNLTSQWLGNVYLHQLDMFVKHTMRVPGYIRYCDDFCLFSNNRRELDAWAVMLREYLENELKLQFSKCVIKSTDCGVDFIGFRHFKRFIILTKAGARKLKRHVICLLQHMEMSPRVRSQLASYNGWLNAGCTYNFRRRLISYASAATPAEFICFLNKYFNCINK